MEQLLLQQIRGELAKANELKNFELEIRLAEAKSPVIRENYQRMLSKLYQIQNNNH